MTPIQEIIEWESSLSQMFDSDERIAMAILQKIRTERNEMLEKEADFMCEYVVRAIGDFAKNVHGPALKRHYKRTFNIKEK
jgi:hypothetical protein